MQVPAGSGSARDASAIQAQSGHVITIDQAFSDRVLAGIDVLALLESRKSAFDEAEPAASPRRLPASKWPITKITSPASGAGSG
jgi:hypothetical protein